MKPIPLTHFTATSCIGTGLAATLARLRDGGSGLTPCDFDTVRLPTWIGRVDGLEALSFPADLAAFDCRNNRLALLGLQQDGFLAAARAAVARHGHDRVGIVLGTSTSGIFETERAYRERDPDSGALPPGYDYHGRHNIASVATFVAQLLGSDGPHWTLSTACSSSAKTFASAARLIASGVIDAAVVGGVDSLCLTTLYGFNALELLSSRPCRPFDRDRDGLSVGEAAAFALLERTPCAPGGIVLAGYGESSDAHHMSAPHPEGLGARLAMADALTRAGLSPPAIDYLNLHGTATPANDKAESQAVAGLFGAAVPASATKGATGHTLGAAGGLEVVLCALALAEGWMPGTAGTLAPDPALPLAPVLAPRPAALRHVLTNSLGFGGTNCSLILSRTPGGPT